MIFKNAVVLNDEFRFMRADVYVDNGIIISIHEPDSVIADDQEVLDLSDLYLIPGFIDIHTHGAMGADHLDGTFEATDKICQYMASQGTTSVLATIMTQSPDKMYRACENVAEYQVRGPLPDRAHIRGIYLEGPFFTEKYKGAQHPEYLMDADIRLIDRLQRASDNGIKIISLAPERSGSIEFIKQYKNKINVFMGHTDSDYNTTCSAIEAGAGGVTHTFNGMRPLHHRDPGILGAALMDERVVCECICDGIHVHPAMIRLLYSIVGRERFVIISDSICPTGLSDGNYESGGQQITVNKGIAYLGMPGKTIADSTIAGSTVSVYKCIQNLVKLNIMSLENAIYAATAVPARAAGIYNCVGSILPGKCADLLVMDKDLNIKKVYIGKD